LYDQPTGSIFYGVLSTRATDTRVSLLLIPTSCISTPVYNRLYGGDAPSYPEYMTQLIHCNVCDQQMQRRSLPRHLQNQHNIYQRPTRRTIISPMFDAPPETYRISMNNTDPVDCPVLDCPATVENRYHMRAHFCFRHWNDTVIIAEEGQHPYPRCPSCLLLGSNIHTLRHRQSQTCIDGTLRHIKRLQQQHNESAEDTTLFIHDLPVANVDIKVFSFACVFQECLVDHFIP
jgi:hypothetical protein